MWTKPNQSVPNSGFRREKERGGVGGEGVEELFLVNLDFFSHNLFLIFSFSFLQQPKLS